MAAQDDDDAVKMLVEAARILNRRADRRKLTLDLGTILAIQDACDDVETGHGAVTLEIKQFRFVRIEHATSRLLPQTTRRELIS